MLDLSLTTRSADCAPFVTVTGPRAERDEFGPLSGTDGLFRASLVPTALMAREDLGHALCAWLPREDLL